MVYFKEHSIKEIHEKEQATSGGISQEDKEKINSLDRELKELADAIERGLTT